MIVNNLHCTVGLSPHVRGNLYGPLHALEGHRSIPARAGEPESAQDTPFC